MIKPDLAGFSSALRREPSVTDAFFSAMLGCPESTEASYSKPGPDNSGMSLDRKLALLRRSGLFGSNTKGCVIERACTAADLRAAYRLVHDVYLETGYIAAEPGGMRLRVFEASPETATFVAKSEGIVVGVLSVVLDSPDLGLPSDGAFRDEIEEKRVTGARLCEVTNQAVTKEFRRSAVLTELMRCAVAHAVEAGWEVAVATVCPSHQSFYELMGFRPLGSQRSYSGKLEDPVVSLSLEIDRFRDGRYIANECEQFIHHFMTEANQFFASAAHWTRQAKDQFLNLNFLEELFVAERDFLKECSLSELRTIKERWGEDLFKSVCSCLASGERSLVESIYPAERPVPAEPATGQASAERGLMELVRECILPRPWFADAPAAGEEHLPA